MIFLHAMEGVFSITIMVAVGYYLTAKGWFTDENAKIIPKLVNYVSLPTLMLWNLLSAFDREKLMSMMYGLTVPLLATLGSCLLGYLMARLLPIAPNRKGIFNTTIFCSNTVFIGIPVSLALFGEAGTPYVLLFFLVNSLFFWTAGNYLISKDGKMSGVKLLSWKSLQNLFSPPFIGFMTATAMVVLGLQLPDFLMNTAKYLGGMTTPLSLIYIGIVLHGIDFKKVRVNIDMLSCLFGRFVASPLLILLVAWWIPIPTLMKQVFVIQAAMPAIMQTAIIAKIYEADTEYAALLTGITTVAAVVIIPLYMVVIS